VAKVQFHPGLKAPLQGHIIDGGGRAFIAQRLVHGGVKVVGRIQMRAVVGGELDHLDRPTLAIGQVLFFQAGKKRFDLFVSVLVVEVLDLRDVARRIAQHVVF